MLDVTKRWDLEFEVCELMWILKAIQILFLSDDVIGSKPQT